MSEKTDKEMDGSTEFTLRFSASGLVFMMVYAFVHVAEWLVDPSGPLTRYAIVLIGGFIGIVGLYQVWFETAEHEKS